MPMGPLNLVTTWVCPSPVYSLVPVCFRRLILVYVPVFSNLLVVVIFPKIPFVELVRTKGKTGGNVDLAVLKHVFPILPRQVSLIFPILPGQASHVFPILPRKVLGFSPVVLRHVFLGQGYYIE